MLPIFRSEAQARILAWMLLDVSREQPISRLTEVSRVAQPNTLREVNRLVTSELLAERRAGNTRLVRANVDSPYFEPLVAILARAYGPASIVPVVLADIAGISQVVIIGSWAERFLGTSGPPPRDVDVVIVGDPDRRRVRAANRELEERLDQPVQLTTVDADEWALGSTSFVRSAKSKPHVVVLDNVATA